MGGSAAHVMCRRHPVLPKTGKGKGPPIEGEHPYVYMDGIVLKRSWGGEVRNVSLLVAIAVDREGFREILGIVEGAKEDKAGWAASSGI
jgi:transposase-like protein